MRIFHYVSEFFDDPDPVIIIPFLGYVNDLYCVSQARVLEDEGIQHSEEDSILKNVWNSYKRFETDEKEGARVRVTWNNKQHILVSDKEGYIHFKAAYQSAPTNHSTLRMPIVYELMDKGKIIYRTTSYAIKPSLLADYGIITDIDDTLLETGVSSTFKWRLLVNSISKHSHKRMPLAGVREFYDLLSKGVTQNKENPFFYISNSPWNLYGYLEAFLNKYDFPEGPLLLRDIGLENWGTRLMEKSHKYEKIIQLLGAFPNMPFILIGDAGELDTDIYLQIARKFPGQILSIYIRAIQNRVRLNRVKRIIEETTDVEILLITDSMQAVEHARSRRYIS